MLLLFQASVKLRYNLGREPLTLWRKCGWNSGQWHESLSFVFHRSVVCLGTFSIPLVEPCSWDTSCNHFLSSSRSGKGGVNSAGLGHVCSSCGPGYGVVPTHLLPSQRPKNTRDTLDADMEPVSSTSRTVHITVTNGHDLVN